MASRKKPMGGAKIAKKNGDRIRAIRVEKNLTQTQLAKRVGIRHQSMLSAYETGSRPMSLPRLEEFCCALGVHSSEILPF